jgi:hypothetical protein
MDVDQARLDALCAHVAEHGIGELLPYLSVDEVNSKSTRGVRCRIEVFVPAERARNVSNATKRPEYNEFLGCVLLCIIYDIFFR